MDLVIAATCYVRPLLSGILGGCNNQVPLYFQIHTSICYIPELLNFLSSRYVINELIETEKDYVHDLGLVVEVSSFF